MYCRSLIGSLLFVLLLPTAFAEQDPLYFGASFVDSSMDLQFPPWDDGSFTAYNEEHSAKGYRIYVGDKLFKNLALELGYIDMGTASTSFTSDGSGCCYVAGDYREEYSATLSYLALVGSYTIRGRVDALFELGGFNAHIDLAETGSPTPYMVDKTSSMLLGLGFDINLAKDFTARFMWENYNEIRYETLSLGVYFEF